MSIDLPGPLGLGGAPLGNMFQDVPDDQALQTVENAWYSGMRLFDTAPFYGAGLSEIRLGEVLRECPRHEFTLSTKVGRLILPEREDKGEGLFAQGRSNRIRFDYSESGTLRSIEESLERMGLETIDVVYIHYIAEDMHGDHWREAFQEAMNGTARALTRLRDEGVIRGWGVGVNRIEPCAMALEQADPDVFLLAGRYTLLDHENALNNLLQQCEERDVSVVAGGPYNSGLLAGGRHFEYQEAPAEMVEKARRIDELCGLHGVDIRPAAQQFSLAHPAVVAVIPGTTRPERIDDNVAFMQSHIPQQLWQTLRQEGVLSAEAPVPAAA